MQAVRNIPGMRSVDAVTGPYDVIAVLEADDLNVIGQTVTERIHTVSGVLRTVTCLAVTVR
ncbi:hypothetical protein HRbin23_01038 [bacterium HR23]|nr:hypothetical protein HRbin23_01038 [bacterium HR23]